MHRPRLPWLALVFGAGACGGTAQGRPAPTAPPPPPVSLSMAMSPPPMPIAAARAEALALPIQIAGRYELASAVAVQALGAAGAFVVVGARGELWLDALPFGDPATAPPIGSMDDLPSAAAAILPPPPAPPPTLLPRGRDTGDIVLSLDRASPDEGDALILAHRDAEAAQVLAVVDALPGGAALGVADPSRSAKVSALRVAAHPRPVERAATVVMGPGPDRLRARAGDPFRDVRDLAGELRALGATRVELRVERGASWARAVRLLDALASTPATELWLSLTPKAVAPVPATP